MLGAEEVYATMYFLQLVSHVHKLYFYFLIGIQSVNFATVELCWRLNEFFHLTKRPQKNSAQPSRRID